MDLISVSRRHWEMLYEVVRDLQATGVVRDTVACEFTAKPIGTTGALELDAGVPGVYVAPIDEEPINRGSRFADMKYGSAVMIVDSVEDGAESRRPADAIKRTFRNRYNMRRATSLIGACELQTQVMPKRFRLADSDVAGELPMLGFEIWTWFREAQ